MTEKGFRIRAGLNKQKWENADFPILCEVCLGENPYVRMTKKEFDKECKICSRPFTVFRWRPGHKARFKKTEICQTCARMKNVCQTCIFDLEFGLPVQVRDKFLKECDKVVMPEDGMNRQFCMQQLDEKADQLSTPYDDPKLKEKLQLLVKKYPSYKRNQAHICSFFVKGECNRGDNCPYRHEMPDETENLDENGNKIKGQSVEQSIRDRFHGVNDSLAGKMFKKLKSREKPSPPENLDITTLFIGGVDETVPETDIVEFFMKYGKVKGIRIRLKSSCAFICFEERSAAEIAMDHLYDKLFINNKKLKLLWAKDQLDPNKHKQNKRSREDIEGQIDSEKAKALTSERAQDDGKLVIEQKNYYPSMDPANYGGSVKKRANKLERKEKSEEDE